MQPPGQTDGNFGQEKKSGRPTKHFLLITTRLHINLPALSDQTTFCEGEGWGWGTIGNTCQKSK